MNETKPPQTEIVSPEKTHALRLRRVLMYTLAASILVALVTPVIWEGQRCARYSRFLSLAEEDIAGYPSTLHAYPWSLSEMNSGRSYDHRPLGFLRSKWEHAMEDEWLPSCLDPAIYDQEVVMVRINANGCPYVFGHMANAKDMQSGWVYCGMHPQGANDKPKNYFMWDNHQKRRAIRNAFLSVKRYLACVCNDHYRHLWESADLRSQPHQEKIWIAAAFHRKEIASSPCSDIINA